MIAEKTKAVLDASGYFINMDEDRPVRRVFAAGGAFDEKQIPLLRERGVELVITGEIHHHHMLELVSYGIAALALGHDSTERVVLSPLAELLRKFFPGIGVAAEMGLDYNKRVFRVSQTIAGT